LLRDRIDGFIWVGAVVSNKKEVSIMEEHQHTLGPPVFMLDGGELDYSMKVRLCVYPNCDYTEEV
jgi:hypothetical protein